MVIANETTKVTAEYDHYDGRQLIKQADTVLLPYPLAYNQSDALSARNLVRRCFCLVFPLPSWLRQCLSFQEYYAKRVDVQGGPAMTWSVHTIGWLRIGQKGLAASMWNRSYQNNVRQVGERHGLSVRFRCHSAKD